MVEPSEQDKLRNEPPGREIVKPAEIMKAVKGATGKLDLTPTQRAGMQLAYLVGALIALVTLLVALDWVINAPRLTLPPLTADNADLIAKIAASYKTLNDAAVGRATDIYDTLVVRALLPVFTTVLGYIFGSQADRRKEEA